MRKRGLTRVLVLWLTLLLSACQGATRSGTPPVPGAEAAAPAEAVAPSEAAPPAGTAPGAPPESPTTSTGPALPAAAAGPIVPEIPRGMSQPPASPSPEGEESGLPTLAGGRTVGRAMVRYGGTQREAVLQASDSELLVAIAGGPAQTLPNRIGAYGEASLQVIPNPEGDHLLVTVTDGRVVEGWVLIPGADGFSVGLDDWVDWVITGEGDAVKVGFREYQDGGGFVVRSFLFRYSPLTRRYEHTIVPGADIAPKDVDLVPLTREQTLYFDIEYPKDWPVVFSGSLHTVRIGSWPTQIYVLTDVLRGKPVPGSEAEFLASGRWPGDFSVRPLSHLAPAKAFEVKGTIEFGGEERLLLAYHVFGPNGIWEQVVMAVYPPDDYGQWEAICRIILSTFRPVWSQEG